MIYDDNKQKKIIEYLFYIFCIVSMNTVILSFIQYQVNFNESKFDLFIREMDSYIKKTNIMYNDMSIFYNKTPLS